MAKEIVAPLAGRVIQLKIKSGDTVEADEEILVVEAMKMETPVFVPCDGTIRVKAPKRTASGSKRSRTK